MSELKIQPESGLLRVFTDSAVGPVSYTLGAKGSEFVVVAPAGEAFKYRGREYKGKIHLRRDTLKEAYGYGFTLKQADGMSTASGTARTGIIAALSEAISDHIARHPEVVQGGERCAARAAAASLARDIAKAERELERMRGELARLRKIGGES